MERITVFDFSGVYRDETFYRDLSHEWIDCTDLSGVNGFCDEEALAEIRRRSEGLTGRIHFIDGGNFHYISYVMVMKIEEPFTLVVFDHHTDMKPSLFEELLSCGCWIKRALDDSRYLKRVVLLGVSDELAETIPPEYRERVTVVPESVVAPESAEISESAAEPESTAEPESAVVPESMAIRDEAWLESLRAELDGSVYLSVDKDAFHESEAVTDWDQGTMTLGQLERVCLILKDRCRVLGVDVCGEADSNGGGISYDEAVRINDRANEKIVSIVSSCLPRLAEDGDKGGNEG